MRQLGRFRLEIAFAVFEPKNALTKKDASLTEASRYKVQLLQRSVHLCF